MRVLIDTNVVLDFLLEREPYYTNFQSSINSRSIAESCLSMTDFRAVS